MKSLSYIFAALSMAFVAQVAMAEVVDMPVVKEGESWEFQTYDAWSGRMTSTASKQVIGTMGEFVRVSYDSREISKTGDVGRPVQNDATLRADMNATVVVGGQKYEKIYYKWPLEVGKRWSSQFKTEVPASSLSPASTTMTTMDSEVKEWETVTVPAGKFKTLKIVTKATWTVGNSVSPGGSFTITRWYSPETKSDVLYTYDSFGADGAPLTRNKQQLSTYNLK